MPISCHFQDCKALLVTSLTHVSSAIAIIYFTFTCFQQVYCLKVLEVMKLPTVTVSLTKTD